MNIIFFLIIMNLMLALTITILMYFISFNFFSDQEKMSPFECGFNPQNSSRLPFSLQFFTLAIMFLIFDVEIAILIPIPLLIPFSNFMIIVMLVTFILILTMGLYYEWLKGTLKWIK